MSVSAPGSGPAGRPDRALRGIPRSRAYWELKAEQMMNRIFDPVEPIDLAVEPAPAESPRSPAAAGEPQDPRAALPDLAATDPRLARAGAVTEASPQGQRPGSRPLQPTSPRGQSSRRPRRPDERLLLIGALCGVCLVSVAGSLLYFGHWTRLQQSIAQERNLLLMERLRSLGPANPSPVSGPVAPVLPAPAAQGAAGEEGLPPPPPQEAWIEQLSSLPQAAPAPPRVLSVPVSPRLAAAAAPTPRPSGSGATTPPRASAPLPQLVGVVAGAGRAPSAIFLVGGSSMSVAGGELIGSTGWRLRSAEGETALIERGGELRQVSIASGNGF